MNHKALKKAEAHGEKFLRVFKKEYSNWLFMSPFIIGFLVFVAYPILTSLYYSFTDYN